jgi:5-methylcytosine-specific restriction endonuclease McrA
MTMQWYSVKDITAAYSLSRDQLRHLIETGKLKTEKLFMGKSRTRNFKYIIPETELSKLAEHKLREPTASDDAQTDYYDKLAQKKREQRERWEQEVKKRDEERHKFLSYYDYLHSDEWQRKRRQRLKLDGYRCQMCGSGTNVQVHHISYDNLRKDAEIDDLVTLCRACHAKVHSTDLAIPKGQRNNRLYTLAVKALRKHNRTLAWELFDVACGRCVPPLPNDEVAKIWQSALKHVYPL